MENSFFIIAFDIFLISVVVANTSYPCSKTGDLRETIDSSIFQCCRGNIEVRQDNKECCYKSGQFYFPHKTLCCDGKLINRTKDKSISCCNNEVIDLTKYICCKDQKIEIPSGLNNAQCCGNKVFNSRSHICCGHNIHTRNHKVGCCGPHIFDKETHWCENGRSKPIPKYTINCGGKQISLLNQSCCKDVPNDVPYYIEFYLKNPNLECCGDKAINPKDEKCCPNEHVIPSSPNLGCCAKGSFDQTKELCCNGQVVPKVGQADACCNIHPYNARLQGCCGNTVYDRATEKCCMGYFGQSVHNITTQCCGQNKLDPGSVCCNNHFAIIKDSPDHNTCCPNRQKGISYNNEEKGCLKGALYTKGEDEPCSDVLIKKNEQICCFGVSHLRTPDVECCGILTFNKTTQMCCGARISNISPKEGRCCGNAGYKFSEMPLECKIAEPAQYRDDVARMCGDRRYEKDEDVCCDNKLYPRNGNKESSAAELCSLLQENVSSIRTFSIVCILASVFSHILL